MSEQQSETWSPGPPAEINALLKQLLVEVTPEAAKFASQPVQVKVGLQDGTTRGYNVEDVAELKKRLSEEIGVDENEIAIINSTGQVLRAKSAPLEAVQLITKPRFAGGDRRGPSGTFSLEALIAVKT